MKKKWNRSIKSSFENFSIATGKRLSGKNHVLCLENQGLILHIACFFLRYFGLSTSFHWCSSLESRYIINSIKKSQRMNIFFVIRRVSVDWITHSANFVFHGNHQAFHRTRRFNHLKPFELRQSKTFHRFSAFSSSFAASVSNVRQPNVRHSDARKRICSVCIR